MQWLEALDKWLGFSVPQFPLCKMEVIICPIAWLWYLSESALPLLGILVPLTCNMVGLGYGSVVGHLL
jgi:hypothetical protein